MSTVRANNYYDTSGGSNAQLYGVASPPNGMGFRNRIINGDCRVDQRNAGASVTVNGSGEFFSVDRFVAQGQSTDGVFTLQRSTVAPAGFTNSLLATVTTADSSIGSTQYYFLTQKIEGFNVADLAWGTASAQTVTVSFWVRSSLTGTFAGSLSNDGANRSYPFTYTISAANTWEQKSVTIPGDTTGTWLTNNGIGLRVYFNFGAGSSYTATAGAWASQWAFNATGATNLIATNGATFYITGVQLEAGTVASAFERLDYGRQLIQCQRYCMAWSFSGSYTSVCPGQAYATNAVMGTLAFPVTPRVVPTGIVTTGTYSSITAAYGVGGAGTLAISAYSTPGLLGLQLTGSSGLVAGNASHIACVSTGTLYTTGSEL